MLKKHLLLTLVCLTLSACMIYAPTYVSKSSPTVVHVESTSAVVSQDSPVTQKTNEVSKRVVLKEPPKSTQRSLAVCGTFTLPREAKPIFLTQLDMTSAPVDAQVDVVLAKKVKELQTYIDSMHSKVEQAHARWLESCEQKLRG